MGIADVDALLESLSPRQVIEWQAFTRDYPRLEARLLAFLCSVLVNMFRAEGQQPVGPEEFLGIKKREEDPMTKANRERLDEMEKAKCRR